MSRYPPTVEAPSSSPPSSTKNKASETTAARELTGRTSSRPESSVSSASRLRSSTTPITPAAMMTPRWVKGLGTARTRRPATTAIVAVSAVLAMFFAMPATAWKTTATAAASRPLIQPCSASTPAVMRNSPKSARMSADGAVNITHAASMPSQPARW